MEADAAHSGEAQLETSNSGLRSAGEWQERYTMAELAPESGESSCASAGRPQYGCQGCTQAPLSLTAHTRAV